MIIRICDRCNKEIKDNYYTIDIYEKEDKTGKLTTDGAMNNLNQNIDKFLMQQKEYCKECIKEIKNIIEGEKNV